MVGILEDTFSLSGTEAIIQNPRHQTTPRILSPYNFVRHYAAFSWLLIRVTLLVIIQVTCLIKCFNNFWSIYYWLNNLKRTIWITLGVINIYQSSRWKIYVTWRLIRTYCTQLSQKIWSWSILSVQIVIIFFQKDVKLKFNLKSQRYHKNISERERRNVKSYLVL